ncbi:hypothetical protein [Nocardiopsis alba]|uniref:hypothetical protein n=1 Tax=Nocardiopsis alba TaxID=53437 RepID=UPI001F4C59DF|nr:hypothetical protein [Nocardiopsis alba]
MPDDDTRTGGRWGRPRVWVVVVLMIAAFLAGGVALTLGPAWEWVLAAAVVFLLGGLVAVPMGVFRASVRDEGGRSNDPRDL